MRCILKSICYCIGICKHIANYFTINTRFDNSTYCFLGVLYFVSATVNPILYNLMSKRFRQAFKRTLCKCCKKESNSDVNLFGNGTHKDSASHYAYGRISRHGIIHQSTTIKDTSLADMSV